MHLKETRSLDIIKQVQCCDGCAGQYRSCLPFCDISYSMQDYGFVTERIFYGSRHGKDPSDGAGAVVKSAARRAITSRMEVINNAEQLASFAKETLTRDDGADGHTHRKRTIIYGPSSDIERNRPNRISSTVTGIRKSSLCQISRTTTENSSPAPELLLCTMQIH
ncbi:Hypothetical predicted protein [Mytilus galloprovincialis]|uniref:Uncharacterized protein n=1 Tax=Mytilus galloprovincialis TaxID=29158 RepID=A0A8B6GD72_MYTGA|nr:Hypothetical predicted protein [Mytilus galloprovincialis]